ncbi:MAG: hypothetical protein Q8Q01_01105 [archaeon]|nr:hypothetical protein [archaeon]
MLNLSQLVRKSERISLRDKLSELINPELYVALDIADYKKNKSAIVSPWFKTNFLLSASHYAFVVFYNVGIEGIFEDSCENNSDENELIRNDELIRNYVNVHDGSGSEVMSWTEKGDLFPADKSYFEALGNLELEVKDRVYRLLIRHSYERGLPFVVNVEKDNFSNVKKDSITDRIDRFNSLLLEDCEQD